MRSTHERYIKFPITKERMYCILSLFSS